MHRRRESEPRSSEEYQTSLELLVQPLVHLWRNLNRRTVRFVGDTWRLMFPYSTRSIRRRKLRAAVLALCVALSIVVFGVFEAHFNATHARFRGRVQPIPMAVDLVATRTEAWSSADVHRLNFMPDVNAVDVGMLVGVYSSTGQGELLALADGSYSPDSGPDGAKPDAGAAAGLSLAQGELPERPDQVLVPEEIAAGAGLRVGDPLQVEWRDGQGNLHSATYEVCGVHTTDDPHLSRLLTVLPRESGQAPIPPLEGAYGDHHHAGGNLVLIRTASAAGLRGDLGRALPGADVFWPEHGAEMAGGLLAEVFSSGRFLVLIALIFSSVGVLNALLLTFLERQRELGVFKALGTLNDEVRIMLWQEGFLTSLVGIVGGMGLTWGLVWFLNARTAASYVLAPVSLIVAVGAALTVFYVGAVVPGLMARNMTVEDLLQRRNII